MLNFVLALGVLFFLLCFLSIGVIWGRSLGKRHLAENEKHKLEVVSVAEGAVFGLLGLLIAFTFSGAFDRFEQRKLHIIEEANAYTSAFQRISLLGSDRQEKLRQEVRDYLGIHLAIYNDIPHVQKVFQDITQAKALENKIWKDAVEACEANQNKGLAQLIIPAFNHMFEEAYSGVALTLIHPPLAIFGLLIGLAVLGAFLTGYSTAENKKSLPIHVLCYIILTAFTIYIVIDLELPRMGLIRVNEFDALLLYVQDGMNLGQSGG